MYADLKQIMGAFKPVNGISCYDSAHPAQFFTYGFPTVRLHDQDYPRPCCVDVAAVFPNWGADPCDPAAYDFRDTDRVIGDLVSHGVQVIYRLGNSIDNTAFKRLSVVPDDYMKWARVCEHIIAHYNEGWKDGFQYGIVYWEIWNEPDLIYLGLTTMWQGTEAQFFDLYRTAAPYLKRRFPNVKIGGYGAARSRAPFFEHFLAMASRERLPLDFFSWHRYGSKIGELTDQADRVRMLLDQYGFQETESILDEWNYTENDWFGQNAWGVIEEDPALRQSFYTRMRDQAGAAYVAGVMIALLDHPVDMAHLYDGQRGEFGCLYDAWGNLSKCARAVLAFNQMAARGRRVEAGGTPEDVYIAASADSEGADILLSCFECKGAEAVLEVRNCDAGAWAEVFLINDFFDGRRVLQLPVQKGRLEIPLSIRPYTVIHICIKKER